MKTIYRCEFQFGEKVYTVRSERGLDAFRDGFWVNQAKELTNGDDVRYWIPPWRIYYVAKDLMKEE